MKRTPLYDEHVRLGARFAPFAGWEMPLHYGSQVAEHKAVRETCGVFDVSHMGQIRVEGPGAGALVQRLQANDSSALNVGRACYGALCNDDGGMIDDLIVTCLEKDRAYSIVVNAGTIERDYARMIQLRDRFESDTAVTNESDEWAMLAVQGRDALRRLAAIGAGDGIERLDCFQVAASALSDSKRQIVSRTGYTGEYGFEVLCSPERAVEIWRALVEDGGVQPCGLGARDTLRLEMGYLLSGQDFDEKTTPLEAGLGWCTKLDTDPPPMGAERLIAQRAEGPPRLLTGLVLRERGIPRHGTPIVQLSGGAQVGEVTSGSFSPTLEKGIALGYVEAATLQAARSAQKATGEAQLGLDIRGRVIPADIVRPPFVKDTSLRMKIGPK